MLKIHELKEALIHLCACSNSLTAPSTTLRGLFSAFKMAVAKRCCTSEMLNNRMVSLGET